MIAPSHSDLMARMQWPELSAEASFTDGTIDIVDEGFEWAFRFGEPPVQSELIARVVATSVGQHPASGLTLITAADAFWNTVYLDRSVRHLPGSGAEVSERLLAHIAPLGREHIGLTGDYLWSEMDKPRERFRPLRMRQNGRDAWRTFPNILSPISIWNEYAGWFASPALGSTLRDTVPASCPSPS